MFASLVDPKISCERAPGAASKRQRIAIPLYTVQLSAAADQEEGSHQSHAAAFLLVAFVLVVSTWRFGVCPAVFVSLQHTQFNIQATPSATAKQLLSVL